MYATTRTIKRQEEKKNNNNNTYKQKRERMFQKYFKFACMYNKVYIIYLFCILH